MNDREVKEKMNNIQIIDTNQVIATEQGITASTFDNFINYLDTTPKTIETYTKSLKQLFEYLYSNGINKPLREDIIAFREELKARGLKPTTVQNYITTAKIFFKWTEQEKIYPNIADGLKGARLNQDHKKDYLTAEQAKEVLKSIDTTTIKGKRDYAIVSLMITGGLRTIEVVRADVGDLRSNGVQTVLYIQGKGKQEKTDFVIISDPVKEAIDNYLNSRKNIDDTQPLFTSVSNNNRGKRLTTRSISGTVKKIMQEAGYDSERLTAHSLRHTAVTLSLLAGNDITEVQQFARHSNISTTMIYNHALEKAKNQCSNSISNELFN